MNTLYCRAVKLVEKREVTVVNLPIPALEQDDMFIRIEMAGVCGTDVGLFNEASHFPVFLGHEPVGSIVEIREGERQDFTGKQLVVGDRVVWAPYTAGVRRIAGAFAEYAVLAESVLVFRVPNSVPDDIAVLAEPGACALRLVERAFQTLTPDHHARDGTGMGRSLLIEGSGPIGALVTALSKLRGIWRVVVVGAPENRLEICKALGADLTLNFLETSSEERANAIRQTCQGDPDAVIEAAGSPGALQEAIELVRKGGTVVEFGFAPEVAQGKVEIDARLLVAKGVTLLGSLGFQIGDLGSILRVMEAYRERVNFRKMITHRFSLERVKDALELASEGICMKAVIEPSVREETRAAG